MAANAQAPSKGEWASIAAQSSKNHDIGRAQPHFCLALATLTVLGENFVAQGGA
jgi:hypothetical protein